MFILFLWTTIVTSLTTTTYVRDSCIKKNECEIVVKEIGYDIKSKDQVKSDKFFESLDKFLEEKLKE